MCNEPIPTSRDVSPDVTVGQHIDQFCKSTKKQKIFTNGCNFKNCKKKELIPFTCSVCKINFCLKHRHFNDHDCKLNKAQQNSKKNLAAEEAALRRQQNSNSLREQENWQKIQGNVVDEDEALARALQMSMEQEEKNIRTRNNEVAAGGASSSSSKDKCSLQ